MSDRFLPSAAAAARIGVKRATLYAYVSRGLLRAQTLAGHRGSWFDPVELDRLARRARGPAERPPDLRITSAITLIERGRYWYRGIAPEALAARHSFEGVAELLWTGDDLQAPVRWPRSEEGVDQARQAQELLPSHATATDRVRVIVAMLGAADPLRYDLRPAGALATARRLVGTTVATLTGRRRGHVADQVASWLSPRHPSTAVVRAIDTTLIVMADHELAASTLAVRIAASFRADPYAAVVAGLGAMAGSWHGAASRQIEEALRAIEGGQGAAVVLGRLLRDSAPTPGFGQPLYPDGDPRVAVLFPLAKTFGPTLEADALLAAATRQGLPPPNVDFGLAALVHRLRLPPGAGEALFTVGRLAGWLAHALEEYADRSALRMRAVYTGVRPD
jgi:citrate synthase